MKALKLFMVIIVYILFLPYIITFLFIRMLVDIVLESINYFKNINL
jgi:hypothetical protein